jgi:hypothetical protein
LVGCYKNDLYLGCDSCPQSRCFGYLDPKKATVFELISNGDFFFMLKHPDGYCLTASKNVKFYTFFITHYTIVTFISFLFYSSRDLFFISFHLKQLNKEHICVQGYDCIPNNDNLWIMNGGTINKDGRALWWRGDSGMLMLIFLKKFYFKKSY